MYSEEEVRSTQPQKMNLEVTRGKNETHENCPTVSLETHLVKSAK